LVEDALAIPVEIDNNLCNLQCCLRAAITRLDQLQCNGYLNEAAILRQQLILGVSYYLAVQGAIMCGSGQAKVDEYTAAFKASLNCDDECTCGNEGEPTLVIPIGSQNGTFTFTSSDGSLTLTETVVGQNTTVDYVIDSTLQAAIYSSDIVVGNTNITVVATGTVPNITYTVTGAGLTAGSGIGISTTSSGGVIIDYKPRLTNLLDSQFVDTATTGTTAETLKTYTLPAGTLGGNATRLRFKSLFAVNQDTTNKIVSLAVNATTIFSSVTASQAAIAFVYFDYELYREDATTLKVFVKEVKATDAIGGTIYSYENLVSTPITVNDLTSSTNTLTAKGDGSAVGDIVNKDFSIEYLGK
jgi:hypothetical protein